MFCVHISVKSALVRTTKSAPYLHIAPCNTAQNILHIHTLLKMSCLQPRPFNGGNTPLRLGVALFKGPIRTFFFDILHIPSGCKWLQATGLVIPTYAIICNSNLWTF